MDWIVDSEVSGLGIWNDIDVKWAYTMNRRVLKSIEKQREHKTKVQVLEGGSTTDYKEICNIAPY